MQYNCRAPCPPCGTEKLRYSSGDTQPLGGILGFSPGRPHSRAPMLLRESARLPRKGSMTLSQHGVRFLGNKTTLEPRRRKPAKTGCKYSVMDQGRQNWGQSLTFRGNADCWRTTGLSFIFKSPLKVHPGDRHWTSHLPGSALAKSLSCWGLVPAQGIAAHSAGSSRSLELRTNAGCFSLHYTRTFWPVCSQLGDMRCLCFVWRQHPSPDSEASGTVTSPWRPGVLMSYPLSLRVFKSCVFFSVTRFSLPCIFCYLFIFFKVLFVSNPDTPLGAQTQDPEIKSCLLYWLNEPGCPQSSF